MMWKLQLGAILKLHLYILLHVNLILCVIKYRSCYKDSIQN